jgi:3alpha(or 20beta)-hydroxysteroid dehydrogenase
MSHRSRAPAASREWLPIRDRSSCCAAIDLAADKIRVNTILPGIIDTPMLAENPPEVLATFATLPPAQRLGTPEEVAEVALFLASSAASYVTGAELSVCGGLSA